MNERALHVLPTASGLVLTATLILPTALGNPEWELVRTYTPTGLTDNDARVGEDFAVNDELLVAGARTANNDIGAALVFDRRTGALVRTLTPSDGGLFDEFGISVALHGGLIAIGARSHDLPGAQAGAVYVFDATSLTQLRKLSPVPSSGQFGGSVAFASEDELIAGAEADWSSGQPQGSAYIINPMTGSLLGLLFGDLGVREFGAAVAVSADDYLVGATNSSGSSGGRVYVYDRTTLARQHTLSGNSPFSDAGFGGTLAVSGNLVAVGEDGGSPAAVHIFDIDTGVLLNTITETPPQDFSKLALAFDAGRLFVGGPFTRVLGDSMGSVWIFDPLNGAELGELRPTTLRANDEYGAAIATRNGQIYISGTGIDGTFANEGRIFRFEPYSRLEVDPDPLVALQDGTFNMVAAKPNERTWMLYSLAGLSSNAVYLRRLNVFVSLEMPQIGWGPLRTDDEGNLSVTVRVGATPEPIDIWFQIVQNEFVSNWVATQIVPD